MTLHVRGFPTIKLFILHGADCLNDASRVWHLWLPRGPVRGNRGGLEKPEKAKDLLLSTTGTKDVVWIFSAAAVIFHVERSLGNNSVDRSLSFGFVPKMKSSNQKYYDDDGKREPRNSYKKIFCGVKKNEIYGESAQVICTDEVRTAFYLAR